MFDALTLAAEGGKSDKAKPFKGVDGGVFEIALKYRGDAFRAIYAVKIATDIWAIHAFRKKSKMVRGSGNVYRDLGRPNAGLERARAITAAKIIRVLDERKLSTRDAEKLTGISHSEFTRIRNAQLRRFTLDRMISILGKLDEEIEVSVTFKPRKHVARDATRAI